MNDDARLNDNPAGKKRRPRYPSTHPRRYDQRYKELDPDRYPEIQEHLRKRGRTPVGTHVPVLLDEVMGQLKPAPGDIVADCTVGYGGHAEEFCRRIGRAGRLVGLDVDGPELERTSHRLAEFADRIWLHQSSFAGLAKVMGKHSIEGFDIIFADLGVSSMQVDDPSRGISYKADGPLDMRMDRRLPLTGADLLARLGEKELSQALWEQADEPDHLKIARFIVAQRQVEEITRTAQLVRLVFHAKGLTERSWKKSRSYSDLHPAARTFQALRILVNDELGALRQLLRIIPLCLKPAGRVGIISFHSGEDRLVKQAFSLYSKQGIFAEVCRKVIQPTALQVRQNPRSGSAKFRWARRGEDQPHIGA